MSLKKQYLKNKSQCKVTFKLSKDIVGNAKSVHLVGEFNNWSRKATPMKKFKEGSFSLTINLESGREYQFRYLLNGINWENDWQADKYVPTDIPGVENSVVVL